MATYRESARDLPIRDQVDVLVAGGGSAGVIAGAAAARAGARTLVVERYPFVGGLVTGGPTGMHTFYNCYHDADGSPNVPPTRKKKIIEGIPQDLVDRLVEADACMGHIELDLAKRFISVITPVDPEAFKAVALELLLDAGADLLLNAVVADAIVDDQGCVRGVVVESKSGREAILAKAVVDATGDADVAAAAGAPYQLTESWPIGMNLRLVGVDVDRFADTVLDKGLVHQLGRGVKLGASEPSVFRLGTSLEPWREASERHGAGIGGILTTSVREGDLTHMNCTGIRASGIDAGDLTRAAIHLRRQISNVAAFFRDAVPGFERSYLVATGPLMGVRRTRQIRAQFDMPRDYVLTGQGAEDEIGRFAFVDLPDFEVENAGTYGIPYRSLLPREIEGLLVAGRSLSTDHVVHNSTRNVGCCMVTGQAAGAAAALAARDEVSPSALDPQRVRELLDQQGAYFA